MLHLCVHRGHIEMVVLLRDINKWHHLKKVKAKKEISMIFTTKLGWKREGGSWIENFEITLIMDGPLDGCAHVRFPRSARKLIFWLIAIFFYIRSYQERLIAWEILPSNDAKSIWIKVIIVMNKLPKQRFFMFTNAFLLLELQKWTWK